MSNVYDLSAFRAKRATDDRIKKYIDAGLTNKDVTIIAFAAARAFTDPHPSFDEVKEIGFDCLRYLYLSMHEEEDATIYSMGAKDQVVLSYGRGHYRKGVIWHDDDMVGETFNLSNEEDPAVFCAIRIYEMYAQMGHEAISLYGQFALDAFYWACNAGFSPIHMQLNNKNNTAGLLLYDTESKCDIVVIAHLDSWIPTQKDLDVESGKVLVSKES